MFNWPEVSLEAQCFITQGDNREILRDESDVRNANIL